MAFTNKQKAVIVKYVEELKGLTGDRDREHVHYLADEYLLNALSELGVQELVDAYNNLEESTGGFWYG